MDSHERRCTPRGDALYAGARQARAIPALLEYLPYRKDDVKVPVTTVYKYSQARVCRRTRRHPRLRREQGSPPEREYSAQEQQDAEEVIAWLARQPWSKAVGMLGISWGGFNSIQMALRKPPALKAILAVAPPRSCSKKMCTTSTVCFTSMSSNSRWIRPGAERAPDFSLDESVIGPRMDSAPWSLNYLKHQRDGAFWRAPILRPIRNSTCRPF